MTLDPQAVEAMAKHIRQMGIDATKRAGPSWEQLDQMKQPYIATATELLNVYFAALPQTKGEAA